MQCLIVNADDFGWSQRVNEAVQLAHTGGILTTASLMVAEVAWIDAVDIARANPALGVGLHLSTTFDRPLLPADQIPHLHRTAGRFESNPVRAGLLYAFSRAAGAELEREMEAQFERFNQTGLAWDHVDGHQHFHMHPTVFRHLLTLCDRYEVSRLRVPRESLLAHFRGGGDGITPVVVGALILQLLCRINLRTLKRKKKLGGRPIFVCDRVYGDFQSSNMNAEYSLRLLDRISEPVCEVYYHPGTDYARKLPIAAQTEQIRDVELAALLNPEVRDRVHARNMQLATYAEAEIAISAQKESERASACSG